MISRDRELRLAKTIPEFLLASIANSCALCKASATDGPVIEISTETCSSRKKFRKIFKKFAFALPLVFAGPYCHAATVSESDWIERLDVYLAAVAIMVVVDCIALFFILRSMRRSKEN